MRDPFLDFLFSKKGDGLKTDSFQLYSSCSKSAAAITDLPMYFPLLNQTLKIQIAFSKGQKRSREYDCQCL
jgi:hypothetical protein